MGALERWLRVAVYVPSFALVFLVVQPAVWWGRLTTRRGSARRVRYGNALQAFWGCTLFELTCRVLGSRLHVEGVVPEGRFVVISNHQSTADISILIAGLRPLHCKFVAKNVLARFLPAISAALSHGGGVAISRRPDRGDFERLVTMSRELEHWHGSAVIFPEARRSRDGRLRPYQSGATRVVARESGLPLLPVAIDGTWPASDLPGFVRGMPGAQVRLAIGAPIPWAEHQRDFGTALDRAWTWTAERIDASRQDGVTPPAPCGATVTGETAATDLVGRAGLARRRTREASAPASAPADGERA